MSNKIIELDVREDIRNGREPFAKIMNAADLLGLDEQLLVIAPFEPVPLFRVMKRRGFRHAAKPLEGGVWEVLFLRDSDVVHDRKRAEAPAPSCRSTATNAAESVEVDARGLEPPQPMVKILEALEILPRNAPLFAKTDRRPLHLYAQLEARGFVGETEEQADGSFLTTIRRA